MAREFETPALKHSCCCWKPQLLSPCHYIYDAVTMACSVQGSSHRLAWRFKTSPLRIEPIGQVSGTFWEWTRQLPTSGTASLWAWWYWWRSCRWTGRSWQSQAPGCCRLGGGSRAAPAWRLSGAAPYKCGTGWTRSTDPSPLGLGRWRRAPGAGWPHTRPRPPSPRPTPALGSGNNRNQFNPSSPRKMWVTSRNKAQVCGCNIRG